MAKTILEKVGLTPVGNWNAGKADFQYLDLVRYSHPTDGGAYIVKIKTGFVPAGTLPTNNSYYALVVKDGVGGSGGGGGTITYNDVITALGYTPADNAWLASKPDLGETATTAYRGDRGKAAYDHSVAAHAPANAQKNSDITKAEIEAKLTGAITSHNHAAAQITESATKRFVTDVEKNAWSSIPTNAQKNSDITKAEIEAKLTGAITSHSHPADSITESVTKRFISDAERIAWSASQKNSDITKAEIEAKLTGAISSHTHPAASITESTTKRFITDVERNAWAASQKNSDITKAEIEAKLTGAITSHTHSADNITESATRKYVTQAEKDKIASLDSGKFKGQFTSYAQLAAAGAGEVGAYAYVDLGAGSNVEQYIWDTTDSLWIQAAGSSTAETPASVKSKYESNANTNAFEDAEKAKLLGLPANAQKNSDITKAEIEAKLTGAITSHSHAAAQVTESTSRRFITDAERIAWNANQKNSDITKAEIEAKLIGEITTHTHTAAQVTESTTKRFVSDAEKATWNANQKNSDITKAEIEARLTGAISSHTHPAAQITESTTKRFITDVERNAWNAIPANAQKNSDITLAEIEAKLTGAITSHSHPAASVTESTTKRFITDVERAAWNAKADIAGAASTGGAIQFDKERIYGSNASPIAANLTTNTSGAVAGVVAKIFHKKTAPAPTMPATWKKAAGSQDYDPAKVNRIYVQYEDASNILYTISYQ